MNTQYTRMHLNEVFSSHHPGDHPRKWCADLRIPLKSLLFLKESEGEGRLFDIICLGGGRLFGNGRLLERGRLFEEARRNTVFTYPSSFAAGSLINPLKMASTPP